MQNGNGNRRWSLVMAIVAALVAIAGYLFQRELTAIDKRLDRISDYILEQHGKP